MSTVILFIDRRETFAMMSHRKAKIGGKCSGSLRYFLAGNRILNGVMGSKLKIFFLNTQSTKVPENTLSQL